MSSSSGSTKQQEEATFHGINFESAVHPDVQRGVIATSVEQPPIFDISTLEISTRGNSGAFPIISGSLVVPIDEEDEEYTDSEADDVEYDYDDTPPLDEESRGESSRPNPSLKQLADSGVVQGSEVLTASLIEIRKHPSKLNEPSHKPKLLMSAIAPDLQNFHRTKSSSTSTLFLNTTIKAPNNDEILRCMSATLYWNIQKFEGMAKKRVKDVFSEELYPLTDGVDLTVPPSQESVYEFLSAIFNAEQLSAECGVMAMAYVDRLQALTGVSIITSTWRRISLGCLILASKVWEDQAVWNVDFLNVFPNLTVKDLNSLEREVLNGLQFNVALKASVYAKYYFELRSLSEKDSQHFPLDPLSKEDQERLEQRSMGIEMAKKKRITRSQSVDNWIGPSPMASLPQ